MKYFSVVSGLMLGKATALEYIHKENLIWEANITVMLSSILAIIAIASINNSDYLVSTQLFKVGLIFGVVLKNLVLYYIVGFSYITHSLLKIKNRNNGSVEKMMSYFGLISPLYVIIVLLGTFISSLKNSPALIILIIQFVLSIWFIKISGLALSRIYNIPQKNVTIEIIILMVIFSPILSFLRYFDVSLLLLNHI